MANKKNWARMLVIVLVFGMIVVGLAFPTRACADDMWANVPNLSLLNGTWKSTYNQSETMIESVARQMQMLTGEVLTPEQKNQAQSEIGDIIQRIKGELTITINASTNTVSIAGTNETTFSGGNIDTLWENLKGGSENMKIDNLTIKINESTHSITGTFFMLKSYEDTNIGFQINQNGTKLKIKFLFSGDTNPISIFPLGTEIIMAKQ